uniref:PH domain-containing protein n=1 Tax=Trichuris muris TaxID=70415 RepID=A0A5S6QIW6_TRIMR
MKKAELSDPTGSIISASKRKNKKGEIGKLISQLVLANAPCRWSIANRRQFLYDFTSREENQLAKKSKQTELSWFTALEEIEIALQRKP